MKRLKKVILAVLYAFVALALPILWSAPAHAAYNPNLITDDTVFDDFNSMSAAQIDTFLNSFPGSCISTNNHFAAPDPTGYSPDTSFTYGSDVTAGTVIYHAAQAYELNPRAILTTLQKEQSLVSGDAGCSALRYVGAMGNGCPDGGTTYNYSGFELYSLNGTPVNSVSGTCVNSYRAVGFSRQVITATWKLKFWEQRSEGNTGWNIQKPGWDNSDDPLTCYSYYMTEGYRKRCSSDPAPVYYDGLYSIDATTVHVDTGATAALYVYTPHFPGNQHYVDIFTNWFGGTISAAYYSCHNAVNVSGAATGEHVISNRFAKGAADNLSLVIPNNTGSKCIEAHTWTNNGYQSWIQHVATNYPAVDPLSNKLLTADLNGDGVDELYMVNYQNTGSGMIEVHGWDGTYQHWASHRATNRPTAGITAADDEVIAADPTGSGHDNLFLVQYRNTGSHHLEIHEWSDNLQSWVSHIATNYGEADPAYSQVVAADLNGDGKDEFYLINYYGTGTGMIEVHGWSDKFQQWVSHAPTNRPAIVHAEAEGSAAIDADVIAADTNGDGKEEMLLVQYKNTGSGMIEVHGWSSNFQQWVSHIATNQGAF